MGIVSELATQSRMQSWQHFSVHSRNIAGRLTDIVGCGYGWRNKASIIIPRQCYE